MADVPSPIDLKQPDVAAEWARTANLKRPWRQAFFALFAQAAQPYATQPIRILELGAGPGFLAEHLLASLPACHYVALDASSAMHALAQARLRPLVAGSQHTLRFITRDFTDPTWTEGLGQFDLVITLQAGHELRHKSRASALHSQVRALLKHAGCYLVCDHHTDAGGMQNTELYMSILKQQTALASAGFNHIELMFEQHGMVMHRADCQAPPDR